MEKNKMNKILEVIKVIFKEQPFLIQKNKAFYLVDKENVIENFKSFELSNPEEDYAQCKELIFTLKNNMSYFNVGMLIETLKNYLEATKFAQDGELKSYYDEISQFFEIKNQNIILNIRHVISTFELNGKKYMLLSLLSDDLFIHCNAIKEL